MSAAESSSEDEDTAKLREAVWSVGPGEPRLNPDAERKGGKSKRLDASKHEEDGNELQTTPEFRSHVAKKLGAMLDSYICEVSSEAPDSRQEVGEKREDERDDDEGFRLFSTSLPGSWCKEPTPPPPPRRRPAPSSSDSDSEMEMRLREAAVSLSDIIPPSMERNEEKGGINNRGEGDGSMQNGDQKKKKKKKKKNKKAAAKETEEEETFSKASEAVPHEQTAEENAVKKKKKKKKGIKLDDGERKTD